MSCIGWTETIAESTFEDNPHLSWVNELLINYLSWSAATDCWIISKNQKF